MRGSVNYRLLLIDPEALHLGGLPVDFDIQVAQRDGLLTVTVTGEWSLANARALVDRVAAECEQRACLRVLVDSLAIQVDGRVLEYERFVLGSYILEKLEGVRLAVLFPEEQINSFTQNLVRGAGSPMLVTSDREEAILWL